MNKALNDNTIWRKAKEEIKIKAPSLQEETVEAKAQGKDIWGVIKK